jgi:hypothetical protein
MAGADGGESSELKDAPDVPDDDESSGGFVDDEPSGAIVGDTQQVPLVNQQPVMPRVRAVARRAAAALPALGRSDGGRSVPRSARSTLDRKKQTKPATDSTSPAAEPSEEGRPTVRAAAIPRPRTEVTVPVPKEQVPTPIEPQAAEAEPDPELVAAMNAETQAQPVVAEAHVRTSAKEFLAMRLRARHLATGTDDEPDEAEAETILGVPEPPVGRHAATAIAEARPDEWAAGGTVLLMDEGGPDVPAGPPLFEEDSWDIEPDEPTLEEYQGRRRANVTAGRLSLVIGLAVVCLGAAIGIPLLLRSGNGPAVVAPTTTLTTTVDEPSATAPLVLATPVTSATPTHTPRATRSATPKSTTTPPTTTTTTPPFAPATYQAEDGVRTGSAANDGPPQCQPTGPRVISRIGNWGDAAGPGTLTLTVSVPSAGTYHMVITYVQTSDTTRIAQISVNGAAPINASFTRTDLSSSPGGTDCVDPYPAIGLTLKQGSNTIKFANPTNHAPTIDKIVLSRA